MNLAIRGCGKFGIYIYNCLKNNKNYNIKYFIDANSKKCGESIDKIPIISPDVFEKENKKNIDIVLVAYVNSFEDFAKIIRNKNIKYGFIQNMVFYYKMGLSENILNDFNVIWSDDLELTKPVFRSLETNIVDNCNLNCRGCSHFSNLYNKGDRISFEIFRKDLEEVVKHVYINQFNMLGGEILLCEELDEYIKFSRKLLSYSQINLITNGLLIPSIDDEFFKLCSKNNIEFSISGYQPTLKIKDKIIEKLEKNRVLYNFREDVTEFGKNIDLSGSTDVYEAMNSCRESMCHFLRDGRIYKCPFEALGNKLFSNFGIDIKLDGGYDIYDKDMDWNQMIYELNNKPVNACKYCGKEQKMEWKITNQPIIDDWVI